MDTHTEQLWRDTRPPFDGLTLWTPPLAIADLREALTAIVDVLEAYAERPALQTAEDWHEHDGYILEAYAERPALQTAEDWHEHDGYISMAYEATWDQLTGAFSGDAALRRSIPGDSMVRRAWRPQDDLFYLRWLVYEDEEPEVGDADLTASRAIVDAVARQLAGIGLDVEIGHARDFFAERWAG